MQSSWVYKKPTHVYAATPNLYNRKPMNSRPPVHPYQNILLVQRIVKEPSLLVLLANIDKRPDEPRNLRKASLQRSRKGMEASPQIRTNTTWAWRTLSQNEWRTLPFWKVCKILLPHKSSKLRRYEPKWETSNAGPKRTVLIALYLPNLAPKYARHVNESFLTDLMLYLWLHISSWLDGLYGDSKGSTPFY